MNKYEEIELGRISPNPKNPRRIKDGPRMKELVQSVQEKGVIEPIVVRPTGVGVYEIVAGERRFNAAFKAGLERIPAIVRALADDEAYEFMIIENLQREDLTDYEEATSFKAFIEGKGGHRDAAIIELAAKIGINDRYIRSRVDVLGLPAYILKAWRDGKLHYGHLEQFLRIQDGPKDKTRKFFNWVMDGRERGKSEPVYRLRNYIDNETPELKHALFSRKEAGCESCHSNSKIQSELWPLEDELPGLRCLKPACFIKNQKKALKTNWEKTEFCKNYKTTGFRFHEETNWNDYSKFYDYIGAFKPEKECMTCEKFLTILTYFGKVDEKRVCFNKKCYESKKRSREAKGRVKKTGEFRVPWHGEFFREEFLAGVMPGKFEEHPPLEDEDSIRLTLFGFASSSHHFKSLMSDKLKEEGKLKDRFSLFYKEGNARLWALIEEMPMADVKAFLVEFAKDVIMNREEVSAGARLEISRFLGIDLMKEFAVTEEYLQKKTIKEMLEFGKKSKLFADPAVMRYLRDTVKKDAFDKCKKAELVDCFLKSGASLVGKIPTEIAPPARGKR